MMRQSLARTGRICVTPAMALAPCPARGRHGLDLSSCCFFQTKAGAPFPRAGGLPEEVIIHFQERLNLLEASFVLGVNVFPRYCDFCVRRGCEPFCVAAWCHRGCRGSSGLGWSLQWRGITG